MQSPCRTRRTTPSHGRRGAVTVEFALVLPLFLLLLFASMEFARMNMIRHAADNAAYEAARAGIIPGAVAADVENEVTTYLQNTISLQGVTVNVTPDPIDNTVEEVTVQVSVPLDLNAWVVPRFGAGQTIVSTSTLRAERYRGIQGP